MGEHKILSQIVELRILLQNICDGFDQASANKKSQLTMRDKVLFMLDQHPKCSPGLLIEKLGVAKSNLALLCKSLCEGGQIVVCKSEEDKRNVFYNITEKGKAELENFYTNMAVEINVDRESKIIEKKLDDVLYFLNKKYAKK